MNTAINIGIDTSQSKLDIFIRPLDLFFSLKTRLKVQKMQSESCAHTSPKES
jgi:hypothetical protein